MLHNILTASIHGSIVIAVVMVLRLVLRKVPKKYICLLWLLAGIRLLLPIPVKSPFSLQPNFQFTWPDSIFLRQLLPLVTILWGGSSPRLRPVQHSVIPPAEAAGSGCRQNSGRLGKQPH